ncbi:hypothetical protein WJX72_010109 [[Myrmecia] bisecta]|uniref:Endoglucanase n=1 Tax=[Myrmecia] bisecta TaxID=41462 RepID=A0AAW1PD38_9CHLO
MGSQGPAPGRTWHQRQDLLRLSVAERGERAGPDLTSGAAAQEFVTKPGHGKLLVDDALFPVAYGTNVNEAYIAKFNLTSRSRITDFRFNSSNSAAPSLADCPGTHSTVYSSVNHHAYFECVNGGTLEWDAKADQVVHFFPNVTGYLSATPADDKILSTDGDASLVQRAGPARQWAAEPVYYSNTTFTEPAEDYQLFWPLYRDTNIKAPLTAGGSQTPLGQPGCAPLTLATASDGKVLTPHCGACAPGVNSRDARQWNASLAGFGVTSLSAAEKAAAAGTDAVASLLSAGSQATPVNAGFTANACAYNGEGNRAADRGGPYIVTVADFPQPSIYVVDAAAPKGPALYGKGYVGTGLDPKKLVWVPAPNCMSRGQRTSAQQYADVKALLGRNGGAETEAGNQLITNNATGLIVQVTPYGNITAIYDPNSAQYQARAKAALFNHTLPLPTNDTKPITLTPLTNTTRQRLPGAGTIESGDPYDYGDVLGMAWMFYETQRSGVLPSTNRISWREDSALNDAAPDGTPLVGGSYDAGDNLILNFPAAFATLLLAWGVLAFPDGYAAAGQMNAALDGIRWHTDFYMKCHYKETRFVVMIGDPNTDHSYWIPPENMVEARPAFEVGDNIPGSEVFGITAAALAAAAQVFRSSDPAYAIQLIAHARDMYALGQAYPGKYSDGIKEAFVYPSSGYYDDLAMAAAWLYAYTGEQQFLDDAQMWFAKVGYAGTTFSWDDKSAGVALMLSMLLTGGANAPFVSQMEGFATAWEIGQYGVSITPKGLSFASEWGSLRYASNAAFLTAIYAKSIQGSNPSGAIQHACWARKTMGYILGDTGRSFVVGYGNNPPTHVHHRAASCPGPRLDCGFDYFNAATPNPHVLNGALVGGPSDAWDTYADARNNYQSNEVAMDYNAGFTGVLAFLAGVAVPGGDSQAACAGQG